MTQSTSTQSALKFEAALLVGLLLFGIVVVPALIYWVGQFIFGDYAAGGFGRFFADVQGRIRSGERQAWFLMAAPYLIWQVLRLTVHVFRHAKR